MKRTMTILLSLLLAAILFTGCATAPAVEPTAAPVVTEAPAAAEPTAEPEPTEDPNATVMFTDSTGRTVEVPKNIERIAVSGPLAQIVLFALAPDKLVGIANAWDETAAAFFDEKYYNLPELGQLYGGKGEMNLESLLASGAQVVIDVGEPKDTIVEDLDALQEQTGIPFVHVTAMTATTGDAYRKLGELLNMADEAAALADYCDSVFARTNEIAGSVEKVRLLYCLGDRGINVIAQGSYHAEIIDLLSDNLAVVDSPSSKGSGNEVDMEQILAWNPDVILFAPGSIYATVGEDPTWQSVNAIRDGRYYEVPFGPYNWMGFPPSVQRYLGMMWMAQLLYPETAGYDLYTEVANYFRLFYHCDITEDQYHAFVAESIDRRG